jgi:hypothetical protein
MGLPDDGQETGYKPIHAHEILIRLITLKYSSKIFTELLRLIACICSMNF